VYNAIAKKNDQPRGEGLEAPVCCVFVPQPGNSLPAACHRVERSGPGGALGAMARWRAAMTEKRVSRRAAAKRRHPRRAPPSFLRYPGSRAIEVVQEQWSRGREHLRVSCSRSAWCEPCHAFNRRSKPRSQWRR